ncbi:MAG: CpaF family protein, partial [Caulobacteraceae bacterium]
MSRFALRRTEPEPEAAPSPAAVEPPPPPPVSDSFLDIRLKLHGWLIDEIDLSKFDKLDEAEMRRQIRALVGDFARAERLVLNG